MSKITKDEVLRVAQLAHLELTETEVGTFERQLDSILSYVEKLNELNTEGVEPMAHIVPPAAKSDAHAGKPSQLDFTTPLREDVEIPCGIASEVLAGAPDPDPPYFRVPKVIER